MASYFSLRRSGQDFPSSQTKRSGGNVKLEKCLSTAGSGQDFPSSQKSGEFVDFTMEVGGVTSLRGRIAPSTDLPMGVLNSHSVGSVMSVCAGDPQMRAPASTSSDPRGSQPPTPALRPAQSFFALSNNSLNQERLSKLCWVSHPEAASHQLQQKGSGVPCTPRHHRRGLGRCSLAPVPPPSDPVPCISGRFCSVIPTWLVGVDGHSPRMKGTGLLRISLWGHVGGCAGRSRSGSGAATGVQSAKSRTPRSAALGFGGAGSALFPGRRVFLCQPLNREQIAALKPRTFFKSSFTVTYTLNSRFSLSRCPKGRRDCPSKRLRGWHLAWDALHEDSTATPHHYGRGDHSRGPTHTGTLGPAPSPGPAGATVVT
ncbi:hypothetical protein P7K49_026068 [Saguinus oedipus]|uniref:Uncharacterized protein n=1 Tax=Saguinus oedipus TaxID=9490 RepID=A0ABQ9UIZ9_SAGOE|nr:hypothetical protein P7K49_026068 [Saguinus oedipus]